MMDTEEILIARIDDAIRLSRKRAKFIGFLDPAEAEFAKDYLKHNNDAEFLFFGGWEDAERVFLAVCQSYDMPNSFPITPITFTYREEDRLSHRDFLGSFMSKGITRASLGDILIEDGRAIVFIKSELADYLLQEVNKVGKVGTHSFIGAEKPLPKSHDFEVITGVIASERIDCLVAFLGKLSREKAASAIDSGLVTINHREIRSVSYQVRDADKLVIRSIGKFVIDALGPVTKKGRIVINCRKYK